MLPDILTYAKQNLTTFEKGSVSSNEIRFFEYDGKKYVLKKPLMTGNNLSPFWLMMKNLFNFTFEKQITVLPEVYNVLKENPHIQVSPFITADESAMIFAYEEGQSWDNDNFPRGQNNAYKLGQFVGFNHQINHKNCGLFGIEDVTDFYERALAHMESCISEHWNSDNETDKKMQAIFEKLKARYSTPKNIHHNPNHNTHNFAIQRNSLIMIDICADQFLYDNENIRACVDLDAYVIGPVEWELCFLHNQIEDWDSFKAGYETYQKLPPFEAQSQFFYFLMALNSYRNKKEIEDFWETYFESYQSLI